MTSLPDLTLLTAARQDRESFGCGHDERHTYYGGACNRALAQQLASRARMDWRALHRQVSAYVVQQEADLESAPSEPAFFSSRAAPAQ